MAREEAPSFAREGRAAGEWASLMVSSVFRGRGLPRGDGRAVLVLPGLFANDLYLQPLRTWLRRIGYKPIRSDLPVNAGCPERLSRRSEEYLHRQAADGPIAVIGHSRGGILGRTIAVRLQERVTHLVLLGSPVGGLLRVKLPDVLTPAQVPPLHADGEGGPGGRAGTQDVASGRVTGASLRARRFLDPECEFPGCGCPFPRDLQRALHAGTRVISIYTSEDPIVRPSACHVPGAQNIEVTGSHSGLAFNVDVYKQIAAALAA